ncbi:TPA: hypothetical protein N0F65_000483 [Lagenidium giganteum]|uniref:DEAD/DEAH box RNA helicase n=1 Tax=Lagenidium giganteum TaxID=4803 RepID=A0AAV2YZF4_9STRA|nr:TPA: hypothetical protein N0F65_000483 [Lagenidium giganteum]
MMRTLLARRVLGRSCVAAPSLGRHAPRTASAVTLNDQFGKLTAWSSATTASVHSQSIGASRSFATKSFRDLGINDKLCAALTEMGIKEPTLIQEKSIEAILAKKDILCTAQTGTGKTLAYLVPVIEQLLREEAKMTDADRNKVLTGRPRAVVVVPSRELALQVSEVAKQLAHMAKFASCTVTSGERKSIQQKNLSRRLDIVIGTPGRLAKCISAGDFFVSRVTTVVADEADTLFDAKMGFRKELDALLHPIQASAAKRTSPLQIVLAAATVRSPLDQIMKKRFVNLRMVSDTNVHQTPNQVREEFVRVAPEAKQSALRSALHLRSQASKKTIVFCRNSASCRSTDHMLREHQFASTCLHGDMPPARRHEASETFSSGKADILVCTDLAARGLHFDDVGHVVMFDFPHSTVDYVHRAGRTGRAGERGFVTSLVTKHDLKLAVMIEDSKRNHRAIKDLQEVAELANSAIPMDKPVDTERQHARATARQHDRRRLQRKRGTGTKKIKHHKLRTF